MFFLHAGDTEIGGFAITAQSDPLYIEEFVTIEQSVSSVTVQFADTAVADYFDQCVDRGLMPDRFARIWCHTHPSESPHHSRVDEETFARVFGNCDWSLMFIIGRTEKTYARLRFSAGPTAEVLLPVAVDWSQWPLWATAEESSLDDQMDQWATEYEVHIHPERFPDLRFTGGVDDSLGAISPGASWWDFEEYEPLEPQHLPPLNICEEIP